MRISNRFSRSMLFEDGIIGHMFNGTDILNILQPIKRHFFVKVVVSKQNVYFKDVNDGHIDFLIQ